MRAKAVLLFGSQARGDALPGSDVDILLVTTERRTRHAAMGTVSFYLYPWRQLLASATRGDLFACHLSYEAKALHDPEGWLDRLHEAFRFKPSYQDEITRASDLAWFLVHHADALPDAIVVRRAAWCVRTVLIARAAEQHKPVFAAPGLVAFSGSAMVRTLIAQKDRPDRAKRSVALLRPFLMKFGGRDPLPSGDPQDFLRYFRRTHNSVARRTVMAGHRTDAYSGE